MKKKSITGNLKKKKVGVKAASTKRDDTEAILGRKSFKSLRMPGKCA